MKRRAEVKAQHQMEEEAEKRRAEELHMEKARKEAEELAKKRVRQNKLLGQLVELKLKEVWGVGLEENDDDIDAEMEREKLERLTAEERIVEVGGVAAIMASLMAEAKKAKRMEGLELGLELELELELSEDLEEEPAEGMDKGV